MRGDPVVNVTLSEREAETRTGIHLPLEDSATIPA